MKTILTTLSALLLATACATPASHAGSLIPASPSEEVIEVEFVCTQGETLTVRFFPGEEKAVLMRHGTAIELPQQRSASGFIYSNGPNTLRGKGESLTVEIGRMLPLQCQAR